MQKNYRKILLSLAKHTVGKMSSLPSWEKLTQIKLSRFNFGRNYLNKNKRIAAILKIPPNDRKLCKSDQQNTTAAHK